MEVLLVDHPCTWVVVSNDENFLELLPPKVTSDQPIVVIGDLEEVGPYLGQIKPSEIRWEHEHVLYDLDELENVICNPNRFDSPSVLLLDYTIPGFENFQEIKAEEFNWLRTILIAGDEGNSVLQALNRGAVDRFVSLSDSDAGGKVSACARELTREYMTEKYPATGLSLEFRNAIADVQQSASFTSFVDDYSLVEFYFRYNPLGILGLDRDGNGFNFQLRTANDEPSENPAELAEMGLVLSNEAARFDFEVNAPLSVDFRPEIHSLSSYLSRVA